MNKKYTIVNSNLNDTEFCIDYFFYIVIFILAIYLVIQFMSTNYKDKSSLLNENFESVSAVDSTAQSQAATSTSLQNKATSSSAKNIANATSCKGWTCDINGQVCPQGTPGASDASYICQNGTWIKTTSAAVGESQPQVLTLEQQLQEAKTFNNILKISKETLEGSMKKQARALYLANNYYKIDDSSFNNEITFINNDFADIRLPESNFNGKNLIKTQQEWNNLLANANGYKNLYKVGDIVIKPSESNISKDAICYKDYETHLSNDPDFKKKYPECMVCSINTDEDYKNTKSWKNTKTNIHKVCLFNPNAPANSTILNYDGCRKLCSTN